MPDESKWTEPPLVVPSDKLQAAAAQHSLHQPSIIDSIPRDPADPNRPYTLDEIEHAIYSSLLYSICCLANDLGYGWIMGVNSNSLGQDYIYVPRGTSVVGSGGYTITGPAFAPNLRQGAVTPDPGAGSGYKADLRTSIEFLDAQVVQRSTDAGTPIIQEDPQPEQLTTFTVDNLGATTPTTSVFSATVFTQSAIGMAAEKNWSDSSHWDVSATTTFSAGGEFFPAASLSFTASSGGSHTTGGSNSTNSNMTDGTTQEYSFSHATPAGMRGVYAISASQGSITLPFASQSELVFGIKIHGFLRWGGGVAFHGQTNYHDQWSGSGDRPIFEAVFGGGGTPFYQALQAQVSENAAPWAWNAMFAQLAWSRGNVDNLIATARSNARFSASGAMMAIKRNDVKFQTISEVAAVPA